jgi:restriction endonuclease S subunit
LEGLEISEVKLSYAMANNEIFRIDSNYFQKQFLAEESVIRRKGGTRLSEMGVQIRSFGAYSLNNEVTYLEDGVPFIRGVNMKNGRVNFNDMFYISPEAHALLWKSEVQKDMVLLSMSGTVGDVAIATNNWKYPANSNQDIAKIDTAGRLNPFVLYAFLLSRFGQNYLKREARGSVQQHVFLSQIDRFEIPQFSAELENAIQSIVEITETKHLEAESNLTFAESSLLNALGLENWQVPEPLSYVRNSSEAFSAGRLDAEHFQPKFADLLNHLKATGASESLSLLLTTNQRGKQPEYAEAGLPVVNSKHVLSGEVRLDDDNRKAVFDDKTLMIQTGDVLINGTGVGTIGRCAPYLHTANAIPDNHVTILRPVAKVDPIYLSVFLNSLAGQMQVAQRLRGSSGQIELYPNDIAQFKIWVAPPDIQANIRHAVEKSFEQKQRATQLLEAAKRAVEIAIEQSEAEALAYLRCC